MSEYLPVGERARVRPFEDETKKTELNQDEVVVGAADWNDGNLWPGFLCAPSTACHPPPPGTHFPLLSCWWWCSFEEEEDCFYATRDYINSRGLPRSMWSWWVFKSYPHPLLMWVNLLESCFVRQCTLTISFRYQWCLLVHYQDLLPL